MAKTKKDTETAEKTQVVPQAVQEKATIDANKSTGNPGFPEDTSAKK